MHHGLLYVSSTDSLSFSNLRTVRADIKAKNSKDGVNKVEGVKSYWQIIELKEAKATDNVKTNSIFRSTKSIQYRTAPVVGDEYPVATSEFFYVKLKENNSFGNLEQVAKQHVCKILGEVDYMPFWYKLEAPINSNGLEMSNIFYETGYFDEVDPGFIFNYTNNCISEPSFSSQWALNSTSICDAWEVTKGDPSIIVAVIDCGVDLSHTEFKNNISNLSYDLISKSSPSKLYKTDPGFAAGAHGTHVAGIIGANQNGNQISGVAPLVTLLPISHPLGVTSTASEELASGISYAWQNNASVINNSWGDQGGAYYNNLKSALLESAISDAIKKGRNGLGSVVVFASGNAGKSPVDYPASSNPDILVVGSINSNFSKATSSSYGDHLDVVAPGDNILSTLPNNQIGYMSGTSMAAPFVSGVAALILSKSSVITAKDVKDRIESTTLNLSGYNYNISKENGMWNNQTGYGLVNPKKALDSSIGEIVGRKKLCYNVIETYYLRHIPDNGTVKWSLSRSSNYLKLVDNGRSCTVQIVNVDPKSTTNEYNDLIAEITINGQKYTYKKAISFNMLGKPRFIGSYYSDRNSKRINLDESNPNIWIDRGTRTYVKFEGPVSKLEIRLADVSRKPNMWNYTPGSSGAATFTIIPSPDFNGPYIFEMTLRDECGISASGKVQFNVFQYATMNSSMRNDAFDIANDNYGDVSIYSFPNGQLLYQAKDVDLESFDIKNTNLQSGVYILYKTHRNSDVPVSEKVYYRK